MDDTRLMKNSAFFELAFPIASILRDAERFKKLFSKRSLIVLFFLITRKISDSLVGMWMEKLLFSRRMYLKVGFLI